MASRLREVLNRFADQAAPISLNQMARELELEPGVLHDMIEYWVRKGKLRAIDGGGAACAHCSVNGECPHVMALPRYYELAGEGDPAPVSVCACCCTSNPQP